MSIQLQIISRAMGGQPLQLVHLTTDLKQPHIQQIPLNGFFYLNLIRQTVGDREDARPFAMHVQMGEPDMIELQPGHCYASGLGSTRPTTMELDGYGGWCALELHPVVAYHLLREPLDAFRDQSGIDLHEVIGRDGASFLHQVEDGGIRSWEDETSWNFMSARLPEWSVLRADPIYKAVNVIINRQGRIRVPELAAKLYISERKLERQFRKKVGISPKAYANIWRFQHALRLIQTRRHQRLQDLVDAAGYYDISHFMKDLRERTGCSSTNYSNDASHFLRSYLKLDNPL